MRIVATLTDRTFHLDHADLCEAWRVNPVGKISHLDDDLRYHRSQYLGEKYEFVEREGVTYMVSKRLHYTQSRDNVRKAVGELLRAKFRVKSAIEVTILETGGVTARCGHY